MIEVTGNLWTYPTDTRIITTNGMVRKDGACVMGRGCAREAAQKYPKLPYQLGQLLKEHGNKCFHFISYDLLTFPVKHKWMEKADPELIKKSVKQLEIWLEPYCGEHRVVMPRPGCGNGGLRWEDVKPLLISLPDTVSVITF